MKIKNVTESWSDFERRTNAEGMKEERLSVQR